MKISISSSSDDEKMILIPTFVKKSCRNHFQHDECSFFKKNTKVFWKKAIFGISWDFLEIPKFQIAGKCDFAIFAFLLGLFRSKKSKNTILRLLGGVARDFSKKIYKSVKKAKKGTFSSIFGPDELLFDPSEGQKQRGGRETTWV